MTEKDIEELFEKLNIEVTPLPSDYSPEEFGKNLMRLTKSENRTMQY